MSFLVDAAQLQQENVGLQRRRGYVYISHQCFRDRPAEVRRILNDLEALKVEVTYDFDRDAYRLMLLSPRFDLAPEGATTPTYSLAAARTLCADMPGSADYTVTVIKEGDRNPWTLS